MRCAFCGKEYTGSRRWFFALDNFKRPVCDKCASELKKKSKVEYHRGRMPITWS